MEMDTVFPSYILISLPRRWKFVLINEGQAKGKDKKSYSFNYETQIYVHSISVVLKFHQKAARGKISKMIPEGFWWFFMYIDYDMYGVSWCAIWWLRVGREEIYDYLEASGPITSWEIDGETWETVWNFIFLAPKSLQLVIAAMKLKDSYSLEGKLWPT